MPPATRRTDWCQPRRCPAGGAALCDIGVTTVRLAVPHAAATVRPQIGIGQSGAGRRCSGSAEPSWVPPASGSAAVRAAARWSVLSPVIHRGACAMRLHVGCQHALIAPVRQAQHGSRLTHFGAKGGSGCALAGLSVWRGAGGWCAQAIVRHAAPRSAAFWELICVYFPAANLPSEPSKTIVNTNENVGRTPKKSIQKACQNQ